MDPDTRLGIRDRDTSDPTRIWMHRDLCYTVPKIDKIRLSLCINSTCSYKAALVMVCLCSPGMTIFIVGLRPSRRRVLGCSSLPISIAFLPGSTVKFKELLRAVFWQPRLLTRRREELNQMGKKMVRRSSALVSKLPLHRIRSDDYWLPRHSQHSSSALRSKTHPSLRSITFQGRSRSLRSPA